MGAHQNKFGKIYLTSVDFLSNSTYGAKKNMTKMKLQEIGLYSWVHRAKECRPF